MQKFLLRLLPFGAVCFLLVVALPAVVDPYNVFHYRALRDNGVEPNKNYVKNRYILEQRPPFDAYLFGSSRVAFINVERIPGFACYNMTYSEGVPSEHLRNLHTMTANDIIPRLVLIGVDDISCFVDPAEHTTQSQRRPPPVDVHTNTVLGYIPFLVNYFDPSLLTSLGIILSHKNRDDQTYRRYFYTNGGISSDRMKSIDWNTARPTWGASYANRTANVLTELHNIKKLCDEQGIRLILFTNPVHHLTYRKAAEEGYLDFLYRLAEVSGYYNFSGLNRVTTDNGNYWETSHYRAAVGDRIIDRVFYDDVDDDAEELLREGFGWYVTLDNRAALLALLKEQLETEQKEKQKNAF